MPRRTDAELFAETAEKQERLTERMARKSDPMIGTLQQTAEDIDTILEAGEAIKDDFVHLEAGLCTWRSAEGKGSVA